MSRAHLLDLFGGLMAAIVFAYFTLFAVRPRPLARELLRRGYEQRGWTEERLALRLRLLGLLGVALALAAILLAVVKFVG
ncbi:MAG TPA: hypothetical protein VIL41_03860 [Coriobacteriia bacterium]